MAEYVVNLTASGGAGSSSATGYTDGPVYGWITSVMLTYGGSPPGTTDVTITEEDTGRAVLTVTNGNTNLTAYPRAAAVDPTNTAITGSWASIFISGRRLKVDVAQANNGNTVSARITWSETYGY